MTTTHNFKTRFAPSPTGYLHLGHALSAYTVYKWAVDNNAEFILRIEDIDTNRCRAEYVDAIYQDLEWLGIEWTGEVIHQSQRFDIYNDYINILNDKGLLYPCFASRTDIENTPDLQQGVDGYIYPNIWRDKHEQNKSNNKWIWAKHIANG